jgi:hypothetical protein
MTRWRVTDDDDVVIFTRNHAIALHKIEKNNKTMCRRKNTWRHEHEVTTTNEANENERMQFRQPSSTASSLHWYEPHISHTLQNQPLNNNNNNNKKTRTTKL